MSLALAVLCAEQTTAQTPWQAAPASPAPLNRPQIPEAGVRVLTNLPVASSQPNPNVPTQTQPPTANRYFQQVQRPAFIPFDSSKTPSYQSFDLPPPPSSPLNVPLDNSASSAQSLIDALPTFTGTNNPTPPPSNRTSAIGLPGASQLLPRSPSGSDTNNQSLQNQPAINTSGLPPFQGTLAGFEVNAANLPPLADLPLPNLTGSTPDGMTMLIGFGSNQPGQPESIQVTEDFWSGKLVAVVGTERVLAGDMAAIVEPIIRENSSKLKTKQDENDARTSLIRQLLPQYTEMKALQQEFFRDIAGNVPPKELQKKQDEVMSRASKAFYDKFVPVELFRKHKVENLADLEVKLQENGLSLNLMKNHFLMQILAMQLEDKYVAETFEIPPADIMAYYNANLEKWQIPARAKWRQLTVRFDRHPDRAEAENRIKSMGNEIVLGGKPFEAVARDNSEGHTAENGGLHDWTTKGSLKSTVIDEAIFSLPPRRLSQIIEDDLGLHIIEVLEREAARTQDMSEIQTEIRKKLSNDIRQEKLKEFRKKVLDRVPIRTLWPEDIPGSRPLHAE